MRTIDEMKPKKVLLLICWAFLFGTSSCEEEIPSPATTFRQFFRILQSGDRDQVFQMLSKNSQEYFKSQHEALQRAIPEAKDYTIEDMLIISHFKLGESLELVEEVKLTGDSAELKVTFPRGEAVIHMIKENGQWKVDLIGSGKP